MYVRLAFAVAAHLEPEILIVDEVLAVGDAQFQKKCIGKMQDVSRQQGRTVLFVSHNTQAVSTLTTRCLLLRNGISVLQGSPRDVIAAYLEDGRASNLFFSAPPSAERPTVTRVEIETSEPNNTHTHGKPLRLTFEVTTAASIRSAAFSFQIVDSLLRPVVHLMVVDSDRPFGRYSRHLSPYVSIASRALVSRSLLGHYTSSGGAGWRAFPDHRRCVPIRSGDARSRTGVALAGRCVPVYGRRLLESRNRRIVHGCHREWQPIVAIDHLSPATISRLVAD